jgi:uncharacterized protein YbjT (DUF2867 family)
MNVLVAGATGNTGQRLVKELSSRNHNVIALVRESSDTGSLPESAELRQGDLTDLSENVCDGCDVVVFAAGSGGDTDAKMTKAVDRDGAMRLIDLAAKSDVRRFVMLSSVGAENPDVEGEMANYLQAKHDADEHLKNSTLTYSIVRPVALTDDKGGGEIRYGDDANVDGTASRNDVAKVLADAVTDHAWTARVALMESA